MVPTRKPFKRVVFCTVLRSATKLGSQRETRQAQLISTPPLEGGMEAIRIGCSGWNYRHWRGPFYAEKLPQKRWFGHYAETFGTVELNTSFLSPADRRYVRQVAGPGAARASATRSRRRASSPT
jgi:hypothetical protein